MGRTRRSTICSIVGRRRWISEELLVKLMAQDATDIQCVDTARTAKARRRSRRERRAQERAIGKSRGGRGPRRRSLSGFPDRPRNHARIKQNLVSRCRALRQSGRKLLLVMGVIRGLLDVSRVAAMA